ncbi:MAG: sugar transferase [Cytophagales bacterium]|nr:sugar transferase [Cytophagales bacterium]
MYRKYFKDILDRSFALISLLILSPVMIVIILSLTLLQKGEVFFIQQRPGYRQGLFKLIKFKTMRDAYDKNGEPLPDEQRLTWIGSFVRKSSLDELPQLVNILKGEMSLIGPRPWLVEYLPLYNEYQKRRHEVKPGITGWAQVHGRNLLDWDDRFRYDIYYVDHMSFLLDLKIIFLTIINVLKGAGVSGKDTVTMKKFTGDS